MELTATRIVFAYQTLLGRTPPATEVERILGQGLSLADLYRTVFDSPEFAQRQNSLPWPQNQVFISQVGKLLYCPIGKNACTFLKQQMVRLAKPENAGFILQSVHDRTDSARTGMLLRDYPRFQAEAFIHDPSFFKFAVWRDPESRLFSAYMDKFVKRRRMPGNALHTGPIVAAVQQARGRSEPDFDESITFREFVDSILANPDPASLDTHWRPQHLYLEGIAYDRIYRMDELNTLLADLERRTGVRLSNQQENQTDSGVGKDVPGACDLLPRALEKAGRISLESFYPPELSAKVHEYYRQDYEILNELEPGGAP